MSIQRLKRYIFLSIFFSLCYIAIDYFLFFQGQYIPFYIIESLGLAGMLTSHIIVNKRS